MTHTKNNIKRGYPNKRYIEGFYNLEYQNIKKLKKNITRDEQDLWWFPNTNMDRKFDDMYMNHSPNKQYECI